MAVGFRKGALGCPYSKEYYGNQGMDLGPDAKRGEETYNVDSGVEGKRLTANGSRSSAKSGSKSSKR